MISAVDQASDAVAKGLRRGDVILTVNNQPTTTEAELNAAVATVRKSGRGAVLLQVLRRGQPAIFLAVRLNDK